MPFGMLSADSGKPMEPCIRWWSRYPCEWALFLVERTYPGMPNNTLSWAVHKQLNQSRCRLGCGLGWDEESICYIGAHIGATWRIRLNMNRPCAAAMRPYVELFWPLAFMETVAFIAFTRYSELFAESRKFVISHSYMYLSIWRLIWGDPLELDGIVWVGGIFSGSYETLLVRDGRMDRQTQVHSCSASIASRAKVCTLKTPGVRVKQ